MRNPKWSKDEVILALDFYHAHFPKIPLKDSDEIKELSETLRRIQIKLGNVINVKYRNVDGVYLKLMNFHHLNPNYSGTGMKGVSKMDTEVFWEYESNKNKLNRVASKIREILSTDSFDRELLPVNEEEDEYETQEGKILTRIHRYRERDPKIVKKKKESVLKKTGKLECEACNFDFHETYGDRGNGFIECHHLNPVENIEKGETTKLNDLILVCSNCHRMIHRKKPWLDFQELKELLKKNND
jgi:5-methylcytosine-specific restriction protein A